MQKKLMESAYSEMAKDKEREKAAAEWVEISVRDYQDRPRLKSSNPRKS